MGVYFKKMAMGNSEVNKDNLKIALVSLQQDAEKSAPIGLVYLATYLKEKLDINSQNIKIIDLDI